MDFSKLLPELTLEQKADLFSGKNAWDTVPIKKLGIPCVTMSDGPNGVRSISRGKTVCFPTGSASACSFNLDLLYREGAAIGEECLANNIHLLLGPGVNIKRTPLCGRNFEYFSEDPFLSSHLAASFVKGIQSKGVGACLKHFLANNQEFGRFYVSAEIPERALHEIYLKSFEYAVKEAKPWAVMSSYNQVNGVFSSVNHFLLTNILKEKWGFQGFVVSDWGAVSDKIESIKAGLDLQMPHDQGSEVIIEAVTEGELSVEYLDKSVTNVLKFVSKAVEGAKNSDQYKNDKDLYQNHHKIAQEIEEESIVLLKNNNNILPLSKNSKNGKENKFMFIGDFFKKPYFQGGGSSGVYPYITNDSVKAAMESEGIEFIFEDIFLETDGFEGISNEERSDLMNKIDIITENVQNIDYAIIFVGNMNKEEKEGKDRVTTKLDPAMYQLIEKVSNVQKNTVVVLVNGAPVDIDFVGNDNVPAIILAHYGGEAVGTALFNILFGKVCPSGHLAETYPIKVSDNPAFPNYPGNEGIVRYEEDIFVGYRHYLTKNIKVNFPFGFGLSYTQFELSNMKLSQNNINQGNPEIMVHFEVKNIGARRGKEVIQLYISPQKNIDLCRPVKELKGFIKIDLDVNETKASFIKIGRDDFMMYEKGWKILYQKFDIILGESSMHEFSRQEISIS